MLKAFILLLIPLLLYFMIINMPKYYQPMVAGFPGMACGPKNFFLSLAGYLCPECNACFKNKLPLPTLIRNIRTDDFADCSVW
jgi:hypothetical protein